MESYYHFNDFNEYIYNTFFTNKKHCIKLFVNNLNECIDNSDIKFDVLIVLNKLQITVNNHYYELLKHFIKYKDYNYIIYIYFKFLLLDNNDKDLLLEHIYKLNKLNNNNLNELVGQIYFYNNFDILNNFMDILDCNGHLEQLNVSKCSNIDNYNSKYNLFNENTIKIFEKFIYIYHRLIFIYHFIYNISKDSDTNCINSKEDFIQRVYMNIDKFIVMKNFINIYYYQTVCNNIVLDRETIENIPGDILILNNCKFYLDNEHKIFTCTELFIELINCSLDNFTNKIKCFLLHYNNDIYINLHHIIYTTYNIIDKLYDCINKQFVINKKYEYLHLIYKDYIEYCNSNKIIYEDCDFYVFLKKIIDNNPYIDIDIYE